MRAIRTSGLMSGIWKRSLSVPPRQISTLQLGNRARARSVGILRRNTQDFELVEVFAATFNRRAFSAMKPVASDWLYACDGSASIVATAGL
jgi:hypothetical protein